MSYAIVRLYHPSHRVPSLEEADRFFQEVFGISSVWRSKIFSKPDPKYPTFPTDYCIFTSIADVFFDCIDPKKYIIDGEQRYEDIDKPRLNGLGWGVEGIDEIYRHLGDLNIRSTDQANRLADPKVCPTASFKESKLFFTIAEDSGLRYEYYPASSMGVYDIRNRPGWNLEPHVGKGALGIQYCSHHTILTNQMSRALKLYVGLMGGQVIYRMVNDLRGTKSVFISLADAVYELAEPISQNPPTCAQQHFEERENKKVDVYHALTWKVEDLGRTETHLQKQGVKIIAKSETTIIVDPDTALGIAWGFTTETIPNDNRFG